METLVTATVLEPVGDLTPEISGRLCEAVHAAVASERSVVITLRSVARFSWSGLCRLADGLRSEPAATPCVAFRDVVPRTRSLLDAVGLGNFVDPGGVHRTLTFSARL
jgi:hypothetical protein